MTTISLISPIINIQMTIPDSSKANKNVKSNPIKKDDPHMGQSKSNMKSVAIHKIKHHTLKSDPIKKDAPHMGQSNMKSDPIKKDDTPHMGQSNKNEIEHKNLFGGEIKHKEFMLKM